MLPDTTIADWSTTAADNSPSGVTPVGTSLAKQIRNMKSVARELSQSGGWIEVGLDVAITDTDEVRIVGDYSARLFRHRRFAISLSSGSTLYGWISGSSVSGGETILALGFDAGSAQLEPNNPGVTIESMAVSALMFIPNNLPLTHHVVDVAITGPASTAAITHPFLTTGDTAPTQDAFFATLLTPAVGSAGWVTQSRAYVYSSAGVYTLKSPLTIPGATVVTYRVLICNAGSPFAE